MVDLSNGSKRVLSEVVLKIMARSAWDLAVANGVFKGADVDVKDGFIHFSRPSQVLETSAKHFRGQDDLVVVAFSAMDLGEALKWETSRGGELFPHLYGELCTDLALWVEAAPLDEDRFPIIPARALEC